MTVKPTLIKIGTRGSPLALRQTGMVRAALAVVEPEIETEVVVIRTSGDWRPEDGETRLNTDEGGKGQFAKEIEEALLAGSIDCAVHSMKDMPAVLPDGLLISCMLEREDPRDALLVSKKTGEIGRLEDLPKGSVVGTASVRRHAFLLNRRPDLKIVPLRGNVETRIEKVRGGQVDATLLALAGLKRLNLEKEVDLILDVEEMLPAAGQGAVGIEIREDNPEILSIFSQINHEKTMLCASAEREVLRVLEGSCHTPIGAYATIEKGRMCLRACVAALDGTRIYEDRIEGDIGSVGRAIKLGRQLGEILKTEVPGEIFKQYAA